MFNRYCRGMVYWAEPITNGELTFVQKGMRPYIIVSNNTNNLWNKTLTVIPCTTNIDKVSRTNTHIQVELQHEQVSIALCEQIITVDKTIMKGFMGMLDNDVMDNIDTGIKIAVGLIPDVAIPKEEPDKEKVLTTVLQKKRRFGPEEMRDFLIRLETDGVEEVMATYGLTKKQIAERKCMYKKKLNLN